MKASGPNLSGKGNEGESKRKNKKIWMKSNWKGQDPSAQNTDDYNVLIVYRNFKTFNSFPKNNIRQYRNLETELTILRYLILKCIHLFNSKYVKLYTL